MDVFRELKIENPGPFFGLKVKLVVIFLTDAGEPKELVEDFVQRMKKANKPHGSLLENTILFIKNSLPWFYPPANDFLIATNPGPLYEDVAADLTKCCASTYCPVRIVPDLKFPADHPWTVVELDSAVEKDIIENLLELVQFSLKQVGMEDQAKKLKVKLQTADIQGFQSVKLCKHIMLPIETHKVKAVNPNFPILEHGNPVHTSFPTPPWNWEAESSSTMGSHDDKVTQAVTVVEGNGGGKRKADADGVGPSSLKKPKHF